MPIGFLTEAEREQLNRFPEHIPEEDLRIFFLLSEADHQAVNRQHDDHTRLGFALQLCTLRIPVIPAIQSGAKLVLGQFM